MIKQLKNGKVILITPDGPRGPRYWVKPGVAYAAKTTSSHIVPFTWSASHYWQLNTWDRMLIPKPFSKIIINISPAMAIKDDRDNKFHNEAERLKKMLTNLDHQAWTKISSQRHLWPE